MYFCVSIFMFYSYQSIGLYLSRSDTWSQKPLTVLDEMALGNKCPNDKMHTYSSIVQCSYNLSTQSCSSVKYSNNFKMSNLCTNTAHLKGSSSFIWWICTITWYKLWSFIMAWYNEPLFYSTFLLKGSLLGFIFKITLAIIFIKNYIEHTSHIINA